MKALCCVVLFALFATALCKPQQGDELDQLANNDLAWSRTELRNIDILSDAADDEKKEDVSRRESLEADPIQEAVVEPEHEEEDAVVREPNSIEEILNGDDYDTFYDNLLGALDGQDFDDQVENKEDSKNPIDIPVNDDTQNYNEEEAKSIIRDIFDSFDEDDKDAQDIDLAVEEPKEDVNDARDISEPANDQADDADTKDIIEADVEQGNEDIPKYVEEETKQLLNEDNNDFNGDLNEMQKDDKETEKVSDNEENIEDSVDPIEDSLKLDLAELFDTMDKLAADVDDDLQGNLDDMEINDNEEAKAFENDDNNDAQIELKSEDADTQMKDVNEEDDAQQRSKEMIEAEVPNVEEKPADDEKFDFEGEARILKFREEASEYGDYEEIGDDALAQLFENFDEDKKPHDTEDELQDNEEKLLEEPVQYINDALDARNDEEEMESEAQEDGDNAIVNQENVEEVNQDPVVEITDNTSNQNNEEDVEDDVISEEKDKDSNQILTNSEDEDKNNEEVNKLEETVEDDSVSEENTEDKEQKSPQITKTVDELTSAEYDDLMRQFALTHADEMLVEPSDEVVPIKLTLSTDEVLEVTSPNHPLAYPTNQQIDWVLEGEGMGIELNMTAFNVNGIFGDYLLIIPGSVNSDSKDGIVFTHHLNEERRYRFLDVNRMFVRFFAHPGMAFRTGFRFTVKLINSPTERSEDLPEAEALLPVPQDTLTVILGGLSPGQFFEVLEEFRVIIADMAFAYATVNEIDIGKNSTLEVTQIVNTTYCNINWPDFENCASVRFAVPLVYEEEDDRQPRLDHEDLVHMWETYAKQDPYASRLRRIGVTEFAIPDDSSVLAAWLVIGAGVALSVAMLAFALWRFSCLEGYSRMPTFSDTDSIMNEKRGLDLYPTPHQTLPPMYTDYHHKYDDTARVDMGGFANKSYTHDGMYSIESDDDDISNRDRNNSITPRDIYNV